MAETYWIVHEPSGAIRMALGTTTDPDLFETNFVPPAGTTLAEVNQLYMPTSDWWWDGEGVVARQTILAALSETEILADGAEATILSGVPEGALVTVLGPLSMDPTEVTGGTATITTTDPGAYTVEIDAGPSYLPWTGSFTAT